jgi:membrane-bound ClpP family serine protease
MEIAVVFILLLVGVLLLLMEMFLIPGLSIAGIGGVVFLGGAVYYAYAFIGVEAGHLTLIGAAIMMIVAIWVFLRSKALERMSLKTEIDSKNDPLKDVDVKVGDEGITSSRIAPMGKVKINGSVIEAKTTDDFIDENTEIVVTKVYSTNVLVERKNK